MEFKQTFSRQFLQSENVRFREQMRIQAITTHVERYVHMILGAAREGKTQYTVETGSGGIRCGDYTPTNDDLIEGFRLKFPDCVVRYGETWESSSRNPNQMNKKSGIIIDWS